MSANVLRDLEVSPEVAKCAQYEEFEFELAAPGLVLARNTNWLNPEDHEYRVNVVDGVPEVCECPAGRHHNGACKHHIAVAIRLPVLNAAVEE